MAYAKSSIAILRVVAAKSGHQFDGVQAHREIRDEVTEYRRWLAAKEQTKQLKNTKSRKNGRLEIADRRSLYQKLFKSLDLLQEAYRDVWREISDDVFLGMNLVEPSEVDDVWTNVVASLEWHRRLIGAASKFAPCRGRRRGSRLAPLIVPLIDIYERHTGSKAVVNRPNGGGKPYGEIIDFVNAVIHTYGLTSAVKKPSARLRACDASAVGNIDETIVRLIYQRRQNAPGRLMSQWRPG
jgi:hypothetical protein